MSATSSPEVSLGATVNRVQHGDANTSSSVIITAIGLYKYEPLAKDNESWSVITKDNESWTEISKDNESWVDVSPDNENWVDVSVTGGTWSNVA